MAAEAARKRCVVGWRFNPFDEELINGYLKPMILGEPLPCNIMQFRQVYGPSSNPWNVFDPDDNGSWFTSPDIKDSEKYTFAFTKLSKLSRSNSGTSKNSSKKAGCGTWVGKTSRDQIKDCDGNVIGEKRYLVFEIKDVDSAAEVGVGFFRMHEYSLSGINAGLDPSCSTVLCKITYDSAKESYITKKPGTRRSENISRCGSKGKKEEGNNKNLEEIGSVKAENMAVMDTCGAVMDTCGVGGDYLNENRTSNSGSLAVMNSVGGNNLYENRTTNFKSLAVINSDVGYWYAAPQDNNGVQEVDDSGYQFSFDGLDCCDFSLEDLGECDSDSISWLPLEDSTHSELEKRKFKSEDNVYQAKKTRLE